MFLVKKKKKPNQTKNHNNKTPKHQKPHNQTTVLYPTLTLCQTLRSATLVFVFLGSEQLCVEQLHLCKPRAGGPGQTLATHSHKAEESEQFLGSQNMFMSCSFFSFYFSIR